MATTLYILFCVKDKKEKMVVFTILLGYLRYFIPTFILGLSTTHLHDNTLKSKYFIMVYRVVWILLLFIVC